MKRLAHLALALLALASPCLASAAEVMALLPATGVNVDEGTMAGAREVLKAHLTRAGIQVVLVQGGGAPGAEPTPAEAVAAGRAAGASRAGVLRLVGLGATLRSTFTVYDASSGRPVHQDDMPADTAEDLDPAMERLAKGYAKGLSAASVAEIDTVTAKESRPIQRVEAARSFGFRLGMVWPNTSATLDHGTGVGMFWAYDTRAFLADLAIDGTWGQDVHQLTFGFGAYYPFSKTNVSPYLGGGVRYAWVDYGSFSNNGFQLYAAGGLIVGRLSTVSIRLQAEYWLNTFSNGGEQVSGAGASLGLGF
jgi:hypothetical protein